MNLDRLKQTLMAAARAAQPDERVPYAFEKRVMARLADSVRMDVLGAWSSALWRAAVCCVLFVAISGAVSLWSGAPAEEQDLAQEFETAVFASADSSDDAW